MHFIAIERLAVDRFCVLADVYFVIVALTLLMRRFVPETMSDGSSTHTGSRFFEFRCVYTSSW